MDGGDSPLLGRGLGLGRSARDSGALELSEACSLFESVLKAESSKDELSRRFGLGSVCDPSSDAPP